MTAATMMASTSPEEVGHDHVQYIFAELAHILDYDFNVKFWLVLLAYQRLRADYFGLPGSFGV